MSYCVYTLIPLENLLTIIFLPLLQTFYAWEPLVLNIKRPGNDWSSLGDFLSPTMQSIHCNMLAGPFVAESCSLRKIYESSPKSKWWT
jgi:hypothetical protein